MMPFCPYVIWAKDMVDVLIFVSPFELPVKHFSHLVFISAMCLSE